MPIYGMLTCAGDGGVRKSILHKGEGYSTPTDGAVIEGKQSVFKNFGKLYYHGAHC